MSSEKQYPRSVLPDYPKYGKSAAIAALLSLLSIFSSAAYAVTCINPPPINGTPVAGGTPPGWARESVLTTPDIISGNGAHPNGTAIISDVSGVSADGGTMGLFLTNGMAYSERWTTTLTGLTAGQQYQVAVDWQQVTMVELADSFAGGLLTMIVDGVATVFPAPGPSPVTDTWTPASVTFTASSTTAMLIIGAATAPGLTAIVADSGDVCSRLASTLTLAKTVVNDHGGTAVDTNWTLEATDGLTSISGIEGATAVTSATVSAGVYTLSESGGPTGYTQTALSCTGVLDTNPADGLTIAPGDNAVCTFTNDDNAAAVAAPVKNIPVFGPFGLLAMLAGLLWFGNRRRVKG